MSKAATRQPELVRKYNAEGREQVAKALDRMKSPSPPPAIREFHMLMDEIQRRDRCTKTEALRRARAEDEDLFRRYQAG
jgi:hypothetical protein